MARRAQTTSRKKKGSGFSASSIFDIASSGKESLDAMNGEVRIRVHVGSGCARELVVAAKEALVAERPGGIVEVMGLEAPAVGAADPDAVIVLASPDETGAGPLIRFYLACEVPCALVAESALDVPEYGNGADGLFGVVSASSPEALPSKVGQWLSDHVDNRIALAANFPCCRDAVVSALANTCAVENAAIGAISFIPGSDFPLMTVSQAKLALDIAASYGCGLEISRAAELAGVVGLGLAYRGIARTVAGLVPGLGWAFKGAMGYAGTVATAKAVQARFEAGDKLSGLGAKGSDAGEAPISADAEVVRLPAPAAASSDSADDYLVIDGGVVR
jgi:uncharacterized protein (DUF697 family)